MEGTHGRAFYLRGHAGAAVTQGDIVIRAYKETVGKMVLQGIPGAPARPGSRADWPMMPGWCPALPRAMFPKLCESLYTRNHWEPSDKPGSVRVSPGSHSSGPCVAARLKRPTRSNAGRVLRSCLVLLRMGLAVPVLSPELR